MRIRSAAWTRFSVPFAQPFTTAHGTLTRRRGLLVRLVTDGGLLGYGEASPIPPFGGGLDSVQREVQTLLADALRCDIDEVDPLDRWSGPDRPFEAAASCAVDTALCDLWAQAEGKSLADWLGGDPEAVIEVNATIGAAETAGAVAAAQRAVAAGFTCVKLKVGVAGSREAELARIAAVRAAIGPGPRLRLDANGAWSVDDAVAIIQAAEPFDLDLVEQPVAAKDIDGLATVRGRVSTPIAADEAVFDERHFSRVLVQHAADVVVIKPLVAAGPRLAKLNIDLLAQAGIGAIVTTTIDSGVGVAAALHLAACLPKPVLACGLATASLLKKDLSKESLPVHRGTMMPPAGPGLGVTVDEAKLARAYAAWHEVER